MSIAPAERVEESFVATSTGCEHSQHQFGEELFHRDGDELFVLALHPCCGAQPNPLILCGLFWKVVQQQEDIACSRCLGDIRVREAYIYLGPVSS
jgi:hypothetical protein